MSVSEARIILHFDIHEPIELMNLTLSFGSLAKQYRKFLIESSGRDGKKISDDDVKLYITKIENNCIMAELAGASNILGALLPVMGYANLFVDFVKNINSAIVYFKGIAALSSMPDPQQIQYSKIQCSDTANFLNVVAQNHGGKLKIAAAKYTQQDAEKTVLVEFTFNSEDAFSAQKGALIALRALEYRGDSDYKNVLMYLHQTNIEEPKSQGKTGDRGIIKSITDKPLPVYWASEIDKDKAKSFVGDPALNPFKASYRVDVNVEVDRNDTPKFYRIMALHEVIPDDDSGNPTS